MTPQCGGIASAEELVPGTHLIVVRRGYRHHGVYAGGGRVIHYAGRIKYPRGLVEEVSLSEFIDGRRFLISRVPDERTGQHTVRRARSRLGERRYDLLRNNCEHFCNWCLLGDPRSLQIESLTSSLRLLARGGEGMILLGMALIWSASSWIRALRRYTLIERQPQISATGR
ncbi:MAG TPA: lecithin retinol acyltransferase family protein [Steroidobacteraceae bacterium]|jgi:hypothetical protein|nr:lecithin retinol acyltransferase family protein [Steroidobacteraceae bacterium]